MVLLSALSGKRVDSSAKSGVSEVLKCCADEMNFEMQFPFMVLLFKLP
jgi:hypothetical protein